jgi:hypothetical protein
MRDMGMLCLLLNVKERSSHTDVSLDGLYMAFGVDCCY